VFLLLGAVVNVAVAWGLALWSIRFATVWIDVSEFDSSLGPRSIPRFVQRLHDAQNAKHSWSGWDARSGCKSFGLDVYTIRTLGSIDHHLQTRTLVVGWPLPSVRASYIYYVDRETSSDNPVFEELDSGILLSGTGNEWWIPGIPLWPGFAINTIFYAAMLWLLWIAPGKIRRFIRVYRGRCPACGFIIAPGTAAASGGPCSECGFRMTS
jgi:hypothetical protein